MLEEAKDSNTEQQAVDAARRIEKAKGVFQAFPDAVPAHLQERVLALVVDIGMDPHMARLSGGACVYRVDADPK